MNFGNILRNLLEEQDISQKQLALNLNITPSTLGGYIQNNREPDFETLKLFARYFNVSTDYLLDFHTDNKIDSAENELMRIFRSLSMEQREIYLEQGKVFLKLNKKENVKLSNLTSKNNVV